MGLRSFLFSSDEGTTEAIRQVLAGLDVSAETCPDAVTAVDKIAHQPYQIVIVDWEQQPEAGMLLGAARERKAAERPITLAIVSNDPSVPKALQAGANSILRKPIVAAQARDTLKTACDLLRSRREPGPPSAEVAPRHDPSLAKIRSEMDHGKEKLRAGEFLQSAPVTPGGSFITESDILPSLEPSTSEHVDALKDLEPVAASVADAKPAPPPPPQPGETRGLEWHLKARGIRQAAMPVPPPSTPPSGKPELLSYNQISSQSSPAPSSTNNPPQATTSQPSAREQKKEAELFAYIEGGKSEPAPQRSFRLGKRAIFGALVLASFAVAAAPQAPWHPKVRMLWYRGQRALHAWLNPQPVTPAQAPVTHENFQQAGAEYRLPVAENIPDATTDPSQIKVLPVIDPTAKKQNNDATTQDQSAVQSGGSATGTPDQSQAGPVQVVEGPAPQTTPAAGQPAASVSAPVPTVVPVAAPAASTPYITAPAPAPGAPVPAPAKSQTPQYTPDGSIPPSLRSQMAPPNLVPAAPKTSAVGTGSLQPVVLSESAARSLLSAQPAVPYPATAKGQQGTVTLQVLIGPDGTVQDAKVLQGSLAFARAAIDGVRQWKFRPYTANGRAVSVQTLITMSFKLGS